MCGHARTPEIGDVRIGSSADYDDMPAGFVIEEFCRFGWGIPDWEERSQPGLSGVFLTLPDAMRAVRESFPGRESMSEATPGPLTEADIAQAVCEALERDGSFTFVDWCDLGEVTIQAGGRTFRATIIDVTDED